MSKKPRLAVDKRLLTNFMPPEGVPIKFRIAGLSARFAAQLADILITVSVVGLSMLVLFFANLASLDTLAALIALLFFALRVPYYVFTELLWNGQTIGKRMLKMRVISADGRSLSPHAVTVRNLMKEMEIFVPGTYLLVAESLDSVTATIVGCWILLLLAVPLMNPRRQRLGDLIANTIVVEIPQAVLLPELSAKDAPAISQRLVFLPHQLDHYGRFELQTLETLLQVDHKKLTGSTSAYDQYFTNVARVAEAIIAKIGITEQIRREEYRDFLQFFYTSQRAYLENRQLFGDVRDDKFHEKSS